MRTIPWIVRLRDIVLDEVKRIRYTRKSTEQEDRQAHSHDQQDRECDTKFDFLDRVLIWRDNQSGRSFARDGFEDLVEFCKAHSRPKSDPGIIEMHDPSRFGRIVDAEGKPDLSAYMLMYLTLEQCGWLPRFVTVELTGNPQVDYIIIAIHATQAAVGSVALADNVSRGKRAKAAAGYWPHAIPPFGTQKFDVRLDKIIERGDTAASKGVGGIILIPHEERLATWYSMAREFLGGAAYENVGRRIYEIENVEGFHEGTSITVV